MSVDQRLRVAQMNDDLHGIRIVTYDVILDALLITLKSKERTKSILESAFVPLLPEI